MFSRYLFIGLAFATWLSASIAGMAVLWNYESAPGLSAQAPQRWPNGSLIKRDPLKQTLLVWIHPHCPCTQATIGELERLLVHVPESVECRVVISSPPGVGVGFAETGLTQTVRRLPRVSVVMDEGQFESKRFGVATSGQVLMYGRNSELLFAGGITAGRGHEGGNPGASALRGLFREGAQSETRSCCAQSSVFGCELFAPNRKQDLSK